MNCKEVTRRLASDERIRANWRDRFLIGLHLFLCDKCRRYKSQLELMGGAAKDFWATTEDFSDSVRLSRLKEAILKKKVE